MNQGSQESPWKVRCHRKNVIASKKITERRSPVGQKNSLGTSPPGPREAGRPGRTPDHPGGRHDTLRPRRPSRLQGSPGTAGHDHHGLRRAHRRTGQLPSLEAPAAAWNAEALGKRQIPVSCRHRHAGHSGMGQEPIGRRKRHRLKCVILIAACPGL